MLRKIIALLWIVAGLGMAGVTFLPGGAQEETLKVPLGGTVPPVQQAVVFRYPRDLPDGEQVLFEMTVPSNENLPASAGGPVQLEGRLELAGADLFPAEIMRVPYHPGQTVSFRWLVTAHADTAENGTLWLVAVVMDAGKQETRYPMLARPIQVEVQQVLGLSFPSARWVGSGMIVTGLIGAIWLLLQRKKS
jgi:hypothetical protein